MMRDYIEADVRFRPYEDGGPPQCPVGSGYAPYIRSAVCREDLAVRVNNIPEGTKLGVTVKVELELTHSPAVSYGRLEAGVAFKLVLGQKIKADGVCRSSIYTREERPGG